MAYNLLPTEETYSASLHESLLEPGSIEEDVFTTPPGSPRATLEFPRFLAMQLEILQSSLIGQYDRDMLLAKAENQDTFQHWLTSNSFSGAPYTTLREVPSSPERGVHGNTSCLQSTEVSSSNVLPNVTPVSAHTQFGYGNQVEHSRDGLNELCSEFILEHHAANPSNNPVSTCDLPADVMNNSMAAATHDGLQVVEGMASSPSPRGAGSFQPIAGHLSDLHEVVHQGSFVQESVVQGSIPNTDEFVKEFRDEQSSHKAEVLSISQLTISQGGEDLAIDKNMQDMTRCSAYEVGPINEESKSEDVIEVGSSSSLPQPRPSLKKAASVLTIGATRFFDDQVESVSQKQGFASAAMASHITSITLPGGGRINIEDLTPFQQIVLHPKFDLGSGAIIMANALVFAFKVQYQGFDCERAVRLDSRSAAERWPGAEAIFEILEIIFMMVFILELFIRIAAQRPRRAVKNPWIWFDSIIITTGAVDLLSKRVLGISNNDGINTSSMRLFRLIRLIRVFKVLQTMPHFDSLFLLLKAIHASLQAMAFSFLLLMVIQIIFGMLMCQILQPVIRNNDNMSETVRIQIFEHFGTFSRSMLTMFEISLANWIPVCRLLVEGVSEWWGLVFILYRCMFCFAVLRVISAVFITETNRVLAHDDELTLMQVRRDKMAYHNKLDKIFHNIDLDGDGQLSWDELRELLANPQASKYLTTLGFEEHDFEKLFWLVEDANNEGQVSIDKFVSKVGKLKGNSKTIDTLSLLKLAHRIDQKLQKFCDSQGVFIGMGEKKQAVLEKEMFEESAQENDGTICRD